ncbi:diphthamide biosynthesis enzyme Dph2 [Methanothermococcus okinawensis]|nr:diphthamide biosynthesis enzyme Dph2 [Methanothermococcus okinawensis]
MWDLETERVINEIKQNNAKRILFQAPEGLKLSVEKEIDRIKKYLKADNNYNNIDNNSEEVELILWGESCFGACDLCDIEGLKSIGIDLIIHYGHEELPYAKPEIPTIFVHAYYKPDDERLKIIRDDIKKILNTYGKGHTIVATTIQFKKMLKDYNPAVILGCRANIGDKEAEDIDNILFVGTGRFHPLMLAYKFKKPVDIYNPITGELSKITDDEIKKFIKKRIGAISKLLLNPPKKIGVVLSTKKGQCRINVFNNILGILKENSINYTPILLNNISPNYLIYDVDAYIICACPRIVLDDYLNYKKPLLTPKEFEMYISKDFDYKFDEISFNDFR